MNIDLKTIAQAISDSNKGRTSYFCKVYNKQGEFIGYVDYKNDVTKTAANKACICSEAENGNDLIPVFKNMIGCHMPQGGSIKIVKRRKTSQ